MTCGTQSCEKQEKGLTVFERYLTLWVLLCIIGGILLVKRRQHSLNFLMAWPFM